MEEPGNGSPVAKVLGIQDLVGEIMTKVGSSKSMICFSAVNKICREARKDAAIARRFAESNKPAFIGFLVDFKQRLDPEVRMLRLVYHPASTVEESAVALRPTINLDLLAGDRVLCSSHGCVLTAGFDATAIPTMYYASFPSQNPRVYTAVANTIPRIPFHEANHTKNTYGQYGVMRKEGPSGLSFFVKDAPDFVFCSYEGASFSSTEAVYIHVCEYDGGMWNRLVSPAIDSPASALFHRNPYSVLHGNKIFMMYLLAYIVCLDLDTKTFSKIFLPPVVTKRIRSWYDYTVCHHSRAGIALVQYWGGKLDTWILSSVHGGGAWRLDTTMNLVENFEPKIPMLIWSRMLSREANPLGFDHFYSVQVRSAAPGGRFVLITLGFDWNLYMVDTMIKKVYKIPREDGDGLVGPVHALTEEWPPKIVESNLSAVAS